MIAISLRRLRLSRPSKLVSRDPRHYRPIVPVVSSSRVVGNVTVSVDWSKDHVMVHPECTDFPAKHLPDIARPSIRRAKIAKREASPTPHKFVTA